MNKMRRIFETVNTSEGDWQKECSGFLSDLVKRYDGFRCEVRENKAVEDTTA